MREPMEKEKWGDGPWQSEQDRVEFRAHGFPCLMLRHSYFGHWCMYVGVPPGHPWYEKTDSTMYDSYGWNEEHDTVGPRVRPEIHGGVTYGRPCDGDPIHGVCHVPQPGEADHAWWIGADFAHLNDMSPGMEAIKKGNRIWDDAIKFGIHDHYWTEAEVREQCTDMARQARSAQPMLLEDTDRVRIPLKSKYQR